MTRWQRRARLVLGVVFVGVIAAVGVMLRQRTPQAPPPPIERRDPKAISETRGGDVIQLKGDRRDIRIEFASQTSYEDGRNKLEAFKATIENRGGRTIIIGGQEAWVGAEQTSYDLRGGVALRTSDGFVATTEQATFTEMEGVLKGKGPVQFSRENLTGSGVGFTYDRGQDAIWLHDKAVIKFAATAQKPALEVTSATAGYSRTQRYARFERAVRMTRDSQIIEADNATIFLQAQADEPDRIELRGGSTITGGGAMGSLQSMQARDINLDYAADGRTLEQSVLTGQSAIQLANTDGTQGQRLEAEFIDLGLAPDGAVTRLNGRERVRMTLPPAPDAPARVITAATLAAAGEAGKGLTAATFEGGAEFQEAGRSGGTRIARGRTIKAQLAQNGTVETAEFSGGFAFEEGRLTAASTEASYQVGKGVLTLRSAKGAPDPHVADERLTVDAPALEVTLSPRRMTAAGGVRTVMSAGRRRQGERGNTLLKDSEPVNVSAAELTFDEEAGTAVYRGKAWLFQGSTSIKGDALTLDDRKGDLTATGNVVSVLPIAGKSAAGGGAATSTGKAAEFQFQDAKRLAVFSKDAQLDGAQGNLQADRIELRLAPRDNTLERLDAQGPAVRVVIEKREATGTQLTYLPGDEQYRLVGSPVKFVESCRETTGRTLTFFRASDKVVVDGNQEQRTQSKGNANCPESPRD